MSVLSSRRSFIIGAGAAGSLAHSAKAAVEPSHLSEAAALFRDLNPERRARMLATLRDSLAVQRLDEARGRS